MADKVICSRLDDAAKPALRRFETVDEAASFGGELLERSVPLLGRFVFMGCHCAIASSCRLSQLTSIHHLNHRPAMLADTVGMAALCNRNPVRVAQRAVPLTVQAFWV